MSESQLKLFDGDEMVVKANDLVRAKANWTRLEHRVVGMMISQLDKEDEAFTPQRIYIKDLMELSGTNYGALYERAEAICSKLLKQEVYIRDEVDGKRRYRGYSPIVMCEYVEGDGCIVAQFNEAMKPFLLQLKKRFTMYRLQNFMQLTSQHSMRMYELLKMRSDLRHLRITVDELRAILSCEHSYSRFSDFKRKVIDKTQKEIAEKTDIIFKYQVERKGQTPTHIRFIIEDENEEQPRMPKTTNGAKNDSDRSKNGSNKRSGELSAPKIDIYALVLNELTQEEIDKHSEQEIRDLIEEKYEEAKEMEKSEVNRATLVQSRTLSELRDK
ncbi:replication initiation protein [Salinibacter ruber]|uniref:Plasmid replication initiation protein n=1 Tax=Salinibacter ruber TaxID=146919 RepID=A0A9X2TJ34_9BACT|nr:replication initiation protein [Salinibacter ruber]MCS3659953.1 plasmid replication initiation protein [Salinibacter ruber]MCS3709994.1 plasmid replication initiation protein [Salinibacter ruber]MCS4170180.1 plasmid replication initiation protein [Salinibacter ruber]